MDFLPYVSWISTRNHGVEDTEDCVSTIEEDLEECVLTIDEVLEGCGSTIDEQCCLMVNTVCSVKSRQVIKGRKEQISLL